MEEHMNEHRFMWSGDNPDDIKEFTSTLEDASFIYRSLNYQFAGISCCFGFTEGPQFTGTAGSIDAMNAVRTLERGSGDL
jgi:hypothetical protein